MTSLNSPLITTLPSNYTYLSFKYLIFLAGVLTLTGHRKHVTTVCDSLLFKISKAVEDMLSDVWGCMLLLIDRPAILFASILTV